MFFDTYLLKYVYYPHSTFMLLYVLGIDLSKDFADRIEVFGLGLLSLPAYIHTFHLEVILISG